MGKCWFRANRLLPKEDLVPAFDAKEFDEEGVVTDSTGEVTDGVIRRMIDKWLKAGVLEDGLCAAAS